ncbi:MAG: hypothetical protein PHO66_01490 [Eubacteriales bacterium]|nr:hypothetical protein [Eubacteriales bacterium]
MKGTPLCGVPPYTKKSLITKGTLLCGVPFMQNGMDNGRHTAVRHAFDAERHDNSRRTA